MKAFRWFLSIALSVGGLWFALRGTDWTAMSESFRNIQSPGWLLLFPLFTITEFSLRALRWKILLSPLKPARWRDLLPITAAGFFVNNVLPFRAGELARVFWTREKTGVPVGSCLTVLAIDRLFDMLCLLTFVVFVLIRKIDLFPSPRPVIAFLAVTVSGLIGMAFLARFPEAVKNWVDHDWIPPRVKRWAHQFIEGAAILRNGRAFFMAYGISLSFWLFWPLINRLFARSFSIPLSFIDSAWLTIAFCFGALLPSAPGYVGTLEAAGVTALQLVGFGKSETFPFILLLHFSQILSTVLWGIPSLWIAGLRIGRDANRPEVLEESGLESPLAIPLPPK
ncbi:MAG: flippase-like domain-containing protein [Elusimicrobia bacterium]|nr:flippase-like domain-containing protein [Elusimicrobiota bacterium]